MVKERRSNESRPGFPRSFCKNAHCGNTTMFGRFSIISKPIADAAQPGRVAAEPDPTFMPFSTKSESIAESVPPGPNEPLKSVQTMLTGDAPFFNDWETSAVDQRQEKIYMYGGIRPYDDKNMPSSDFHCLDLKTNQWLDLTVGDEKDALCFLKLIFVFRIRLNSVPETTFTTLLPKRLSTTSCSAASCQA
jgi:hypothetical protein